MPAEAELLGARRTPRRGGSRRDLVMALIGVLPALALFGTFVLYPLFRNLFYAFTDYDGFSRVVNNVGFANFVRYFTTDTKALKAFQNTILYSIMSIALGTTLQLTVALIVYRQIKGSSVYKAIFYIPSIVSIVIASIAWRNILQLRGMLNRLLTLVSLDGLIIDWLGNPNYALVSLVIVTSWISVGYGAIILLAGLNAIPEEILEAAEIDGATGFRQFYHVKLPLMMYSITVLLFVGLTSTLKQFALPFVMTYGGPIDATLTVSLHIYNNAFQYNRFGYAAASSVMFTLFVGLVTIIQLKVTRSREVEY